MNCVFLCLLIDVFVRFASFLGSCKYCCTLKVNVISWISFLYVLLVKCFEYSLHIVPFIKENFLSYRYTFFILYLKSKMLHKVLNLIICIVHSVYYIVEILHICTTTALLTRLRSIQIILYIYIYFKDASFLSHLETFIIMYAYRHSNLIIHGSIMYTHILKFENLVAPYDLCTKINFKSWTQYLCRLNIIVPKRLP